MSKAYQSQKTKSNQAFKLQDLLRELDTEAPGQQVRRHEVLNQGNGKAHPAITAQEFTMPLRNNDFKEFDFLKNKKPNNVTVKKDTKGSKRDVSAPKYASARDMGVRTRTMERLTNKSKEKAPASGKTAEKIQSQRAPVQPPTKPIAKPASKPEPKRQVHSVRDHLFSKPMLPIKLEPQNHLIYQHHYNSYNSDDDLEPLAEQIHANQPSPPRNQNGKVVDPIFGFTSSYKTVQNSTAVANNVQKMSDDEWKNILMEGRESLPDLLMLIKSKNNNKANHHDDEQAAKKRQAETIALNSKRAIQQSVYERNREFLQRRKEHIKQIERETSASFRPKINKKSILIDQIRRGRDASPRYESLHALDEVLKDCKEDLKEMVENERFEKYQKEELKNCTFKPKINSTQSISPSRNYMSVAERGEQWKQKAQEKIQSMARMAEVEELKDCTFKPQILKKF